MSLDQTPLDYAGTMLVAMPAIYDASFRGAVVLVCAHSADGAMGLVVNRLAAEAPVQAASGHAPSVLHTLAATRPIHAGGPAEPARPFVLHSTDWADGAATLRVDDDHALTATPEALATLSTDRGPDRALVALGYAGWGPGQLEDELRANLWLQTPADPRVVFDLPPGDRWRAAAALVGVTPEALSGTAGHA